MSSGQIQKLLTLAANPKPIHRQLCLCVYITEYRPGRGRSTNFKGGESSGSYYLQGGGGGGEVQPLN